MRRGSVTTYADDSRRTSAVMTPMERRNTANSIGNNSANRHEFSFHEEEYESPKGMFISFRSIAFVFVFFLAIFIVAGFVGYYVVSPPEDEVPDGLAILAHEVDEAEKAYELSETIKPLRYSIELEPIAVLDAEKGRVKLKGRVEIVFQQQKGNSGNAGPNQVVLNAQQLSIRAHRLRVFPSTASDQGAETNIKIGANKTDDASRVYVLMLGEALRDGNYSLVIEYEATVDENVVFVSNHTKNGKEALLLVSKLKPANAPRLFPTLGDVNSKASFILSLLRPHDTKSLSNMPLADISKLSDEEVIDEFIETPRLSTHNLAFVTGSLDHLGDFAIVAGQQQHSVVAHWGYDEHNEHHEFYLQDKILPVIEVFTAMFRTERPIEKLDFVVVPIDFDGTSAPGLIVIKESLFYAATSSPSLSKTRALLNLIGLIGQQWLDGFVNAKNWTDAWFLEGSVIYLQHALLNKIDQSLEASDDFLIDVQLEAMENDGYLISKALSSKVEHNRIEAFDLGDNYRKGACLISMMHEALGESTFAEGYADFFKRWSYSYASADEFLRSLVGNATVGDGGGGGGGDESTRLDDVFRSWIRQPGYPLINVKWGRNNGTLVIRQEKFNFDEFSNEDEERLDRKLRWWVPLTYTHSSDSNWSEPSIVWLKGDEEMVLNNLGLDSQGNESWIIFNVDKKGYYRVNYDEDNWGAIISALRANHSSIPSATRASLIDDALSLARQGSLSYETAFELLDYLAESELDYAPWRAFSRHASQLDFALYETNVYPEFQEYMRNLASKLYDETKAKVDQGRPLAVLAMQLACSFEYQKCTSWARNQWDNVLRDTEYKLAKHVRETVYCVGAQRGGRDELAYLMQKHAETVDRDEKNRLLSALGCFQTPWILQNTLNEILEADKYDENDIRVILKSYSQNPAAAQAACRFVQDNWKEIVKRFSHSYWTMKSFVDASTSLLFTEHDLNEFNAFRDKNIDSLKTMGHWVALNEMKASSWIFRLKQSFNSLQTWFKSRSNDDI